MHKCLYININISRSFANVRLCIIYKSRAQKIQIQMTCSVYILLRAAVNSGVNCDVNILQHTHTHTHTWSSGHTPHTHTHTHTHTPVVLPVYPQWPALSIICLLMFTDRLESCSFVLHRGLLHCFREFKQSLLGASCHRPPIGQETMWCAKWWVSDVKPPLYMYKKKLFLFNDTFY